MKTLTESDLKFLIHLDSMGDFAMLKQPISSGILDLEKRGYVSLSKARLGPLGIYTGEETLALTEAGRIAVKCELVVNTK